MSKHFFHETTTAVKDSRYHRLIYCEWCGLVAWDFNRSRNDALQALVGNECEGNPPTQKEKK